MGDTNDSTVVVFDKLGCDEPVGHAFESDHIEVTGNGLHDNPCYVLVGRKDDGENETVGNVLYIRNETRLKDNGVLVGDGCPMSDSYDTVRGRRLTTAEANLFDTLEPER
jgi:hypothetical protein